MKNETVFTILLAWLLLFAFFWPGPMGQWIARIHKAYQVEMKVEKAGELVK